MPSQSNDIESAAAKIAQVLDVDEQKLLEKK